MDNKYVFTSIVNDFCITSCCFVHNKNMCNNSVCSVVVWFNKKIGDLCITEK